MDENKTKDNNIRQTVKKILDDVEKTISKKNEIPNEHKSLLSNELEFEEESYDSNVNFKKDHSKNFSEKHKGDLKQFFKTLWHYQDLYSAIDDEKLNHSNKILLPIRKKLHKEIKDWQLLPLISKQTSYNVELIKTLELLYKILHKLDMEEDSLKSTISNLSNETATSISNLSNETATSISNLSNETATSISDLSNETAASINDLSNETATSISDLSNETAASINDLSNETATSISNAENIKLEFEKLRNKLERKNLEEKIILFFKSYLEKTPPQEEVDWYANAIEEDKMKLEDVPNHLKQLEEYAGVKRWKHGDIYTIFGTKMYLNKNDRDHSRVLGYLNYWEFEESKFLKSYVKEDMQIVDIGANIGYFTLLFSKWVGQNGKIFSFEPEPENFTILQKNIIANQCRNVLSYQQAISDSSNSEFLYLSQTNPGDHRITSFYAYEHDEHRSKIKIDTTSLDSFFQSNSKINLIKMDIEGAEGLALKGMTNLINENKKLSLYTEFWPYALEKSGTNPKEFIEQLTQFGFKIFIISDGIKKQISSQFKLIHDYTTEEQTNLFCEK